LVSLWKSSYAVTRRESGEARARAGVAPGGFRVPDPAGFLIDEVFQLAGSTLERGGVGDHAPPAESEQGGPLGLLRKLGAFSKLYLAPRWKAVEF